MQTNKTVISLVLAGLATGAATWYLLGTENGKNLWNRITGSARNISDNTQREVKGHYNDRSYQQKHAVDSLETAVL
ncbi:MAG: hypothetical protein JWQ25_838 [Daejeonella sp.]|nr:hypothetical protein [Daejeonella sp.]